VAVSGTDARDLVDGYDGADAAAADQDAPLGLPRRDGPAHRFGKIRVIDRRRVAGPDVPDLVSQFPDVVDHLLFQFISGMIRPEHHAHSPLLEKCHYSLKSPEMAPLW